MLIPRIGNRPLMFLDANPPAPSAPPATPPASPPATPPAAPPAAPPATPPAAPPAPGGQTFTAEYVEALRGESANYRTQLRAVQAAARSALGIAEGIDLPQDLGAALTGLKTSGQQTAAEELTTAKAMYASGLFAAAGATKLANVDAAFALVAQAGYTIDVDLKTKTLAVKGADGKQLADKDGKALTGQAAMGALVDKLVEVYPFLKGQAGPGQVGGTTPPGGGPGEETPQQFAKRIADERAAARGGAKQSFWNRGAKPQQ